MEIKNWLHYFGWFIGLYLSLGTFVFIEPDNWNFKEHIVIKLIVTTVLVGVSAFIMFLIVENFDVVKNLLKTPKLKIPIK